MFKNVNWFVVIFFFVFIIPLASSLIMYTFQPNFFETKTRTTNWTTNWTKIADSPELWRFEDRETGNVCYLAGNIISCVAGE